MKKRYSILFILGVIPAVQAQTFYSSPFAHTFSVVARDSVTGEMGIAVQSHWFSVGTAVSWGEAGVGVVATQSFVNESFGIRGLDLLRQGKTPQEALDQLLSADSAREVRQVAILDSKGRVATFTGKNCIAEAGHLNGNNFSVQANLMLNDKVWPAMAKAYKESKGQLAERLVTTLEAAQAAGGDIRGKQSAAILVVKGASTGKVWEDRLIDLRVEDNKEPIKELRRLLQVHRAYEHMSEGDLAIEKNDMERALKEYATAEEMFPQNVEMKFWHAISLVNKGEIEKAIPLFKAVFKVNVNWVILLPRLTKAGLLTIDEKNMKRIVAASNQQ